MGRAENETVISIIDWSEVIRVYSYREYVELQKISFMTADEKQENKNIEAMRALLFSKYHTAQITRQETVDSKGDNNSV